MQCVVIIGSVALWWVLLLGLLDNLPTNQNQLAVSYWSSRGPVTSQLAVSEVLKITERLPQFLDTKPNPGPIEY